MKVRDINKCIIIIIIILSPVTHIFISFSQVQAVYEGLTSVVPKNVLSCITWENLEDAVCGASTISVADLKANCKSVK